MRIVTMLLVTGMLAGSCLAGDGLVPPPPPVDGEPDPVVTLQPIPELKLPDTQPDQPAETDWLTDQAPDLPTPAGPLPPPAWPGTQPGEQTVGLDYADALTLVNGGTVRGRALIVFISDGGKETPLPRDRIAAVALSGKDADSVKLTDGQKPQGRVSAVRFGSPVGGRAVKFSRTEITELRIDVRGEPATAARNHDEIREAVNQNKSLHAEYQNKLRQTAQKDIADSKASSEKDARPLTSKLASAERKYRSAQQQALYAKRQYDYASSQIRPRVIDDRNDGPSKADLERIRDEALGRYRQAVQKAEEAQQEYAAAKAELKKIQEQRGSAAVTLGNKYDLQAAALRETADKHTFIIISGGSLSDKQMREGYEAIVSPPATKEKVRRGGRGDKEADEKRPGRSLSGR